MRGLHGFTSNGLVASNIPNRTLPKLKSADYADYTDLTKLRKGSSFPKRQSQPRVRSFTAVVIIFGLCNLRNLRIVPAIIMIELPIQSLAADPERARRMCL